MGMEAPSQPQTERLKLARAPMKFKLLDQDFVYVQRKAEREERLLGGPGPCDKWIPRVHEVHFGSGVIGQRFRALHQEHNNTDVWSAQSFLSALKSFKLTDTQLDTELDT